jgi:hypothetical protein
LISASALTVLFESQSRQPEEEPSHEDLRHRFGVRRPRDHFGHGAGQGRPRQLAHIYQSDAQGNQTFPNPDRDFWGEYFYSRVF